MSSLKNSTFSSAIDKGAYSDANDLANPYSAKSSGAYSSAGSSIGASSNVIDFHTTSAIKGAVPAEKIEEYAQAMAHLIREDITFQDQKFNPLSDGTKEQRRSTLLATKLVNDQQLTSTATGGNVVQKVSHNLMTQETMDRLRNDQNTPEDTKLIFGDVFCKLNMIVPGVFLTGLPGLERSLIKKFNITLIINATNEGPLLSMHGITSYRVPVVDTPNEPIGLYFDDVSNLIEANRRRGKSSVVHCMAGVSRSTTLILAYMIKYTNLSLLESFMHTKAIRLCIRPNMGFMKQLMDFELKTRGEHSTQMVQIVHPHFPDIIVTVPDFYVTNYPGLFESEAHRQETIILNKSNFVSNNVT